MLRGANNQVFCKCHRVRKSLCRCLNTQVWADPAFANTKKEH